MGGLVYRTIISLCPRRIDLHQAEMVVALADRCEQSHFSEAGLCLAVTPPGAAELGGGSCFLHLEAERTSRSRAFCPQQRRYCGLNCVLPQIRVRNPSPPGAQNTGGLGEGSLQRGLRYNEVSKVALIPQECVLIRREEEDIDTHRWMTT